MLAAYVDQRAFSWRFIEPLVLSPNGPAASSLDQNRLRQELIKSDLSPRRLRLSLTAPRLWTIEGWNMVGGVVHVTSSCDTTLSDK